MLEEQLGAETLAPPPSCQAFSFLDTPPLAVQPSLLTTTLPCPEQTPHRWRKNTAQCFEERRPAQCSDELRPAQCPFERAGRIYSSAFLDMGSPMDPETRAVNLPVHFEDPAVGLAGDFTVRIAHEGDLAIPVERLGAFLTDASGGGEGARRSSSSRPAQPRSPRARVCASHAPSSPLCQLRRRERPCCASSTVSSATGRPSTARAPAEPLRPCAHTHLAPPRSPHFSSGSSPTQFPPPGVRLS